MLPTGDCDDCVPEYLKASNAGVLFASLPFLITFVVVAAAVLRKLFPLLSGGEDGLANKEQGNGQLPTTKFDFKPAKNTRFRERIKPPSAITLAQMTFATNIALSAVLVEILLCEISGFLPVPARRLALRVTIPSLLILLILVAPALEVHSILSALGISFEGTGKTRYRIAWLSEILAFGAWLLSFWFVGHGFLGLNLRDSNDVYNVLSSPSMRHNGFLEGCLERIGIIGISLMASLSGFAAISAPWQSFGVKQRLITDADISRKQAGLDATEDMLMAKRSRLRALERRMSESNTDNSLLTRVIGTFRSNSETQERQTLYLEISGLETMRIGLNNTLYTLRTRRTAQVRAHTATGRLLNTFTYGFALYCIYRLCSTILSILRRMAFPSSSNASTDPVTHILSLLTVHWDSNLDRAAWSRQISFLLSGVMLLLSFNSALQTFLLLGRAFPSLLSAFHSNLALVVSQICASYVISSALLLRSNLPREVSSVISDALGAPLEPKRVDAWFEGWFLGAACLTALGIWVGRKFKGNDWDEEEYASGSGDLEAGKRN